MARDLKRCEVAVTDPGGVGWGGGGGGAGSSGSPNPPRKKTGSRRENGPSAYFSHHVLRKTHDFFFSLYMQWKQIICAVVPRLIVQPSVGSPDYILIARIKFEACYNIAGGVHIL